MSSSISTHGDVVIITQVLPRGKSVIPLEPLQPPAASTSTSTSTQQTPPPPTAPTAPTKMGDATSIFLRGCPLNLGVVQIILGVLCVLFSLTSALTELLVDNAPFCLAIVFVVSGSVAVAAGSRTSVKQVWASLISNAVSVMVSAVGVAYVSWLVSDLQLSLLLCDDFISGERKHSCVEKLWLLDAVVTGLLSLLLVLLVLQLCVSVTVTVFSGKSIRCQRPHRPLSDDGHSDDRGVSVSENHCEGTSDLSSH